MDFLPTEWANRMRQYCFSHYPRGREGVREYPYRNQEKRHKMIGEAKEGDYRRGDPGPGVMQWVMQWDIYVATNWSMWGPGSSLPVLPPPVPGTRVVYIPQIWGTFPNTR